MYFIIKLLIFLVPVLAMGSLTAQESDVHPLSEDIEKLDLGHSHKRVVPYLSQHDVHQFIEKIRQKGFTIHNETDELVKVKFKGFKDDHEFKTTVNLKPKKEFSVDREGIYADIFFKSPNIKRDLFFNLEKRDHAYRVTINTHPRTPALIPFHFRGDFTPHFLKYDPLSAHVPALIPYGPQYLVDPPTNLEDKFIDEYDGHLRYLLNVQFPGEKINPAELFANLNEVYCKYSLEAQSHKLAHLSWLDTPKIPPITHTIWLTSSEKPIEFPEAYTYWLKKSIQACPLSQGFKHIFWVSDKSKLPKTMQALLDIDIEVHEISELGEFPLKEYFLEEVDKKRFGRASDILRIIILKRFGGIYKDTDYRFHQSFLPLLHLYNFIACREPMSSFIGNAMIAACPDHPVLNEYLALLERNYTGISIPPYIKRIPENDGFKTILMTGPGVFTTAVAKALGKGGVDIIFPHEILFPTPLDNYPQKRVIKPGESVPDPAYGVHYWETSWARPKDFGSIG